MLPSAASVSESQVSALALTPLFKGVRLSPFIKTVEWQNPRGPNENELIQFKAADEVIVWRVTHLSIQQFQPSRRRLHKRLQPLL